MKKFLPVTLFIFVIGLFLGVQLYMEGLSLSASVSTTETKVKSHYENLYKSFEVEINNKKVKLSEIKEKVVILNFWASWCVPCIQEFPSLVEFQEKYKKDVVVIGFNYDEEEKEFKQTTLKYKHNFYSVQDTQSKISEAFMVNAIPVTITFLNGKVVHVSNGAHDFLDKLYLKSLTLN